MTFVLNVLSFSLSIFYSLVLSGSISFLLQCAAEVKSIDLSAILLKYQMIQNYIKMLEFYNFLLNNRVFGFIQC